MPGQRRHGDACDRPALLQGQRAEAIAADLPDIPVPHIYAAITYYLADRERIDAELADDQAEADRLFEAWQRERRAGSSSWGRRHRCRYLRAAGRILR